MDVGLKAVFVGKVQVDPSIRQGVMNGEYSPESVITVLQWREVFHSQLHQQCLKGIVINETRYVEK